MNKSKNPSGVSGPDTFFSDILLNDKGKKDE